MESMAQAETHTSTSTMEVTIAGTLNSTLANFKEDNFQPQAEEESIHLMFLFKENPFTI